MNIVLIKGLGTTKHQWLDFPKVLQTALPKANFVAVDTVGFGDLSLHQTPLTLKENIPIIKEYYNLTGPSHFIGTSLGGMILLEWAKHYPEDVQSLFLINCSTGISPQKNRMSSYAFGQLSKAAFTEDPVESSLIALRLTTNSLSEPQLLETAQFMAAVKKANPPAPGAASKKLNMLKQLFAANRFVTPNKLEAPIHFVSGKKDRLAHYSCALDLAKWLNASVDIHEHSGHDLTLDAPDWLAGLIKDWVKQHHSKNRN